MNHGYLIGQEAQDLFGIATGKAFCVDGLTSFALDDDIAEQQMLADADASNALAHYDGLVVADEFAFVIRYFIVIDGQFVRENSVSIAGNAAGLKCICHCDSKFERKGTNNF